MHFCFIFPEIVKGHAVQIVLTNAPSSQLSSLGAAIFLNRVTLKILEIECVNTYKQAFIKKTVDCHTRKFLDRNPTLTFSEKSQDVL